MSKWQTYDVRVEVFEGTDSIGATWVFVKARNEDEATRKALKELEVSHQLEGSKWHAEVMEMRVVA